MIGHKIRPISDCRYGRGCGRNRQISCQPELSSVVSAQGTVRLRAAGTTASGHDPIVTPDRSGVGRADPRYRPPRRRGNGTEKMEQSQRGDTLATAVFPPAMGRFKAGFGTQDVGHINQFLKT